MCYNIRVFYLSGKRNENENEEQATTTLQEKREFNRAEKKIDRKRACTNKG